MSQIRRTALIALAGLAAAAPAASAAGWSTPVTISKPHTFIEPLWLTPNYDNLVAAWGWGDGVDASRTTGFEQSALPNGGPGFTAERDLPADLTFLGGYQHTRLLAVTEKNVKNVTRTNPTIVRIAYARGSAGRSFGSLKTLARTAIAGRPAVGLSPNGHGVIAYIESQDSTHRAVVHAAIRNSSGSFGTASVISGRSQAQFVSAAAGDHGDLLVAFVRDNKLQARVRKHGHSWGSIQTVTTATSPTKWDIKTAMDSRGRAEIVYRRRQLGRQGAPRVNTLEASYQPVGQGHFKQPQIIEPEHAGTPSDLVTVPGGWAVAYTQNTTGDQPSAATPRIRMLSPRAGKALDAAGASTGVLDVRVAFSGGYGLFATWVQQTPAGDGGGIGRGAFAPSVLNPAFGPAEDITPDEAVSQIAPGFGLGGPNESPIAVWAARPEGTGPSVPVAQLRTVVRTALRSR